MKRRLRADIMTTKRTATAMTSANRTEPAAASAFTRRNNWLSVTLPPSPPMPQNGCSFVGRLAAVNAFLGMCPSQRWLFPCSAKCKSHDQPSGRVVFWGTKSIWQLLMEGGTDNRPTSDTTEVKIKHETEINWSQYNSHSCHLAFKEIFIQTVLLLPHSKENNT